MRFLFFLLLLPTFLCSQDKYPRQNEIDIIRYRLDLELSVESDEIKGQIEVEFTATEAANTLNLDLVNASEGMGMTVSSVLFDSEKLSYQHKNEKLSINLSAQMVNDGGGILKINYAGIPQDGLIISKNKHGDRTFFADNWPNRAHHWFPCIDHPYEKAIFECNITAPNHYTVVNNGEFLNKEEGKNGNSIWHFHETSILPTKVMVIGVAKFAQRICSDTTNVLQSAYVYPQEEQNGLHDYCRTTDILAWFEEKLGPYPYNKLDHVQSKTRYGGMENAGCIFYHENSIDGKFGSEDLFAHEIAHQWFGNSASEADWHHVWLSEGFATYLTEVYKEETYDDSAFRVGMEEARKRVEAFHAKFPKASIVDTTITDLNRLLSPMTYQKAAWVLHMLRTLVGDKVFWKGIRNYYQAYAYSNAMSVDFQREMEKVYGKDLSLFFNTWLYQGGLPKVKVKYKYSRKDRVLLITLKQPKKNWFVLPIQFGVNKSFLEVMDVSKMTIAIEKADPPYAGVKFDYLNNCLLGN